MRSWKIEQADGIGRPWVHTGNFGDDQGGRISIFQDSCIVEFRPVSFHVPLSEAVSAYRTMRASTEVLHAHAMPHLNKFSSDIAEGIRLLAEHTASLNELQETST